MGQAHKKGQGLYKYSIQSYIRIGTHSGTAEVLYIVCSTVQYILVFEKGRGFYRYRYRT